MFFEIPLLKTAGLPEMLAGLGVPRIPIEICNGHVMDRNGNNVAAEMREAVEGAAALIGKLISGSGIFTQALRDAGYPVIDAEDLK